MLPQQPEHADRERRLDEAIAEYLEAVVRENVPVVRGEGQNAVTEKAVELATTGRRG